MAKLQFEKGFTLIELLVVIAIIAVLAAVVLVLVNPLELMRRGRDATRLQDLDNISKAISVGLQDNVTSISTFLCTSPATAPCTATSNTGTSTDARKNDGTGWVKVNFAGLVTVTVATLPLDPTNDSTYHYTYYSDGSSYELDAVLESSQYNNKMQGDGGDNNNVYETGTALTLLN